jgi:predicted RNA-binding protein YlqC (UPF0109 family)
MKDLILYIAQAIVDNPDHVSVTEIHAEHTTVYELRVDRKDFGKILGKQGRTIQAIRTIVKAVSGKTKRNLFLELVED